MPPENNFTISRNGSAVRYALMGSGDIAKVHARVIDATRCATLVAVSSRNRATGAGLAARYDCDYEPDYGALLKRGDIDAVAIATPGGTHADLAIAAANAGKHVVVEKPLDVTVKKVDAIIAACDQNHVRLGAIFQYRYGEGAILAKRAIERGRLGRITQASAFVPWLRDTAYFAAAPWRANKALSGGGALMNQAIHAVDLLLWLAGDPVTVSAVMDRRVHEGIEVEDNLAAWLKFGCGALGLVQASTCCYPGESKRVEIKGERGSITLVDDIPTLWAFMDDDPVDDEHARELARPKLNVNDIEASLGYNGARDPKAITHTGHELQYEDFTRSILTGCEPAISGREARRSVAAIEAIYSSAEQAGAVMHVSLDRH
ncbi:MAG TPA: Gfo/Idh/MocA family oxidoreductase [Capsulimonadaceae bacterium]|jgi:predicted dehydrogenase